MTPGSRSEKIFVAFWTFLLSGLCHVVADWQAGEPCHPYDDLIFFVANFMAGAVELLVVRRPALVKRCCADDDRVSWFNQAWSNTIKASWDMFGFWGSFSGSLPNGSIPNFMQL